MRRYALQKMAQVLDAGLIWGYLAVNPAAAVEKPRAATPDPRPFESWTEVDAIASEVGLRMREGAQLVIFDCAVGLRPQEWQVAWWLGLDIQGRQYRVSHALKNGVVAPAVKTDGSLRTLVLQQRALDAVTSMARPLDR